MACTGNHDNCVIDQSLICCGKQTDQMGLIVILSCGLMAGIFDDLEGTAHSAINTVILAPVAVMLWSAAFTRSIFRTQSASHLRAK